MQTEEITSTDTAKETAAIGDAQGVLARRVEEVEALVQDFRKLLVRFDSSLHEEGVREHLEALERWMESFRRGLRAASKISEFGPVWLREAQDKLKLAADELQRMDAESPAPATSDNAKKAEDYMKATRRIDAIIPAVDHALTQQTQNTPDPKEVEHAA